MLAARVVQYVAVLVVVFVWAICALQLYVWKFYFHYMIVICEKAALLVGWSKKNIPHSLVVFTLRG